MAGVKAILFDLDGVLVDAREWHYESLNNALKLFGFEITRDLHLNELDGLPTRKKLEYLSITKNFPQGLHNYVYELKQLYTKEAIAVRCFPVFQHEYAVARLKREGFSLALCTNSIRETMELMMNRSRLAEYFEIMVSNQDCPKPKPEPDMFLIAMESLGAQPAECLIIEDNDHGVEAVRRCGGHLMRVRDPGEVTYWNIRRRIDELEGRV